MPSEVSMEIWQRCCGSRQCLGHVVKSCDPAGECERLGVCQAPGWSPSDGSSERERWGAGRAEPTAAHTTPGPGKPTRGPQLRATSLCRHSRNHTFEEQGGWSHLDHWQSVWIGHVGRVGEVGLLWGRCPWQLSQKLLWMGVHGYSEKVCLPGWQHQLGKCNPTYVLSILDGLTVLGWGRWWGRGISHSASPW